MWVWVGVGGVVCVCACTFMCVGVRAFMWVGGCACGLCVCWCDN